MGVYIPGIKMPVIGGNRGIKAEIRQIDGKLEFGIMTGGYACCEQWTYYPIVPVPPHGRLGDLDTLTEKLKKHRDYHLDDSKSGPFISEGISQCIDIVNGPDTPVLIQAEK